MKKVISIVCVLVFALGVISFAQENEGSNKHVNVPEAVKNANMKKYPESKNYRITWEKENGNYEANWGGKDGEANSVTYTPTGEFIEIVKEIPTSDLPKGVLEYIKEHYKASKFGDVGKVLDARGITTYEVEINRRDVIFDENGKFVKEEK
ncbi:MAG: PepSY-like domain-containing protein [Bacteroidetes bacterium]|nr:PepSY-like domain-containing protein [Bacteroidota bacterium]